MHTQQYHYVILNVASFADAKDSIVVERLMLSNQLQGLTQDNVSFTSTKDGTIKFISIQQGASIHSLSMVLLAQIQQRLQ